MEIDYFSPLFLYVLLLWAKKDEAWFGFGTKGPFTWGQSRLLVNIGGKKSGETIGLSLNYPPLLIDVAARGNLYRCLSQMV